MCSMFLQKSNRMELHERKATPISEMYRTRPGPEKNRKLEPARPGPVQVKAETGPARPG